MIMILVRYVLLERKELEFSIFANADHDDHFMMVKMIIVKIMMTTMMMLMALIMQFTTVLTRWLEREEVVCLCLPLSAAGLVWTLGASLKWTLEMWTNIFSILTNIWHHVFSIYSPHICLPVIARWFGLDALLRFIQMFLQMWTNMFSFHFDKYSPKFKINLSMSIYSPCIYLSTTERPPVWFGRSTLHPNISLNLNKYILYLDKYICTNISHNSKCIFNIFYTYLFSSL